MLGYHKVDDEEYLDRNGYFRTGDSGYLDESGILHWGGRLSGMIKTAGANVSPEEVRSKLLQWGRLSSFRSEEHTSELQSLMRTSYAVFCLKKKNNMHNYN